MRRRVPALILASTLGLGLGACAEVDRVVDDAQEQVSEGLQRLRWCTAAFRLGTAVEARDVEAARDAAEDLRANAPDELTDDLDLILEAIDAAESGDPEQIEGEEVRDAGQRVLDEAEAQCDPTTRPD